VSSLREWDTLARLGCALVDAERRSEAALALARHLGVEELVLFVDDPELGILLPALGFRQTLAGGARLRAFLSECARSGRGEASLYLSADRTQHVHGHGIAVDGGCVLLLLGGDPRTDEVAKLEAILPLMAATMRAERSARHARAYAASVHEASEHANALAARLDAVRQQLQRALSDVERARARSEFLVQAGTLLASSLDYDVTLGQVASLAVAHLAEWCVIDIIPADATMSWLTREAQAPSTNPDIAGRRRDYVLDPRRFALFGEILRSGRSMWLESIPRAASSSTPARDELARAIAPLDIESSLIVPLIARERPLGTIWLSSTLRRFAPDDVSHAEELAHRAALYVDNARLFHEAQRAIRARDEFLSIASHELRTPLAGMRLQLQATKRVLATTDVDDRGRGLTKRIDAALSHMDRLGKLMHNLLDVSRLTFGQLHLECEAADLADVVRTVADAFAEEAARAGCAVSVSGVASAVGHWDRMRLEQIISNLVSNALKYGPQNPVEIAVLVEGRTAKLCVRDHGAGIAPEHIDHVFERFTRFASADRCDGLGLGLFITRQIVEAHGGAIHVESEPHVGSTFTVDLPLDRER
jgi:signal transduction histidine kinase